jgi:formylglycine-generating enzyme required for sulfatase activity
MEHLHRSFALTCRRVCFVLAGCYSSAGADGAGEDNAGTDSWDVAPDGADSDTDVHPEGSTEDGRSDTEDGEGDGTPTGMILVPEGAFLMGSDTTDCVGDEPMHEVRVSAFYIDQFEVTNSDFEACVAAGSCAAPASESLTRSAYYGVPEFRDYPVLLPDWESAVAYCTWAGKRLPTEAEWEKATRGGCELGGDPDSCEPVIDARRFPWGDSDPTCATANVFFVCLGDTSSMGEFSNDVSAYGVRNVGGNVAEWVADYYDASYYTRSPADDPIGPTAEEAWGRCPSTGRTCHVIRGHGYANRDRPYPTLDLTCRGDSPNPFDIGVRCALSYAVE